MIEDCEINTSEDFDNILRDPYKGDSYVVITNTSGKKIAHLITCKSIKRSDFIDKVITSKGKYGKYYWFKKYDEAKSKFNDVRECRNCCELSKRY